MTNSSPLDQRFERARNVSEKLQRYLEVERQYQALQAQLRELERDEDVRRALGLESLREDEGEPSESTALQSATGAEPSPAAGAVDDVPRSPGGRFQRGYLDRKFKPLAKQRFSDRFYTIAEMRDILAEELGANVSRGTVQSLVRRATERGVLVEKPNSEPAQFKCRFGGIPTLTQKPTGGSLTPLSTGGSLRPTVPGLSPVSALPKSEE
ncbi:MAG TPA: hypothetical protein VF017_22950 [Thermoanaerobaculia bacterium]|nr:hypothetical protein [Thermoanaerobaculia bacterium]